MVYQKEFIKEFRNRISSTNRLKNAPLGFQHHLTQIILSNEPHPASENYIERYFGPYRLPGTTSIGKRRSDPDLFQDTLDATHETYDQWLYRTISTLFGKMKGNRVSEADMNESSQFVEDLTEKIGLILDFETPGGYLLCEAIPQQMYEDVFIRMILIVIEKRLETSQPFLYREFNALCYRMAMSLLTLPDFTGARSNGGFSLSSLIHVAVICGYVGINLKSSSSAASTLLNRELIPVDRSWVKNMKSVSNVSSNDIRRVAELIFSISESSGRSYGLDKISDYFSEVVDTDDIVSLAFFSDDYMESIIDLKRFEIMLGRNRNLNILFIPRNGRYGNDFSIEDFSLVLKEPLFKKLQIFIREGRFNVSSNGPMAGCIDQRFISEKLIEELDTFSKDRKLIFETKGCRNFEMLKGSLPIPWYTSFNCNRALSIRTVGIDIEPVFLRIPPGINAYDGFDDPVIGDTPSNQTKNVRFARVTTRNLYDRL